MNTKKIENFMLPEHFNKVYPFEASTSLNLTREVANKINELIAAVNQFSDDDIKWKQDQDGAVRKAILYMKDNLLNSLNDLMVTLRDSGFIDSRIQYHCESLKERVDMLLAGSLSEDAEIIDMRTRYDGEMFVTSGEAMREIDKELNKTIADVYNLIHPYEAEFNLTGYVKPSGIETLGDTPNFRTGLVPCNHFKYVTYKTQLDSSGYMVAFYTKTKSIMTSVSWVGDNDFTEKTISIPEGAWYVQVSGVGKEAGELVCKLHSGATLYDLFELLLKKDTPYLAPFPLNGYVRKDGAVIQMEGSARTGLVDCSGYSHVSYKTNLDASSYEVAFYDRTRNLIHDHSIIGNARGLVKTVAIPETAFYVQVSVYFNPANGITEDTVMCKLFNQPVSATNDKKILIFGDSITESATMSDNGANYLDGVTSNWTQYIPELLGTSNIKNYARSGAHYGDFETDVYRQKVSNQIGIATATEEDCDIIIMALGTNDIDVTSVESYESAMSKTKLDRTELYQAVRYAMMTLRMKYPHATCYVVTPLQRFDKEPFSPVSDAIVKMGKRYNFIVIDAESEIGIVRENEPGVYLTDGLHPNEAGKKLMGEFICNRIKSTYCEV